MIALFKFFFYFVSHRRHDAPHSVPHVLDSWVDLLPKEVASLGREATERSYQFKHRFLGYIAFENLGLKA